MTQIKLKDAFFRELEVHYHDGEVVKIRYQARSALKALECDRCKRVFDFPKGQIGLWFEGDGPHQSARTFHVCGLVCANAILNGEYETIPVMSHDPPHLETFPYKGKKVRDYMISVGNAITEEQLIAFWEKDEHRPPILSQGGTLSSWKNALRLEGRDIEVVSSSE